MAFKSEIFALRYLVQHPVVKLARDQVGKEKHARDTRSRA